MLSGLLDAVCDGMPDSLDCETFRIPPLMPKRTIRIPDEVYKTSHYRNATSNLV